MVRVRNRTADDDLERLRLARMPRHYTDDRVAGTINAYRAIADGTLKADRVDTVAPAGEVWERNTAPAIQAALERSRIGALVLALPCSACGAQPEAYCYPSCGGLCGPRVHRAIIAIAATAGLVTS